MADRLARLCELALRLQAEPTAEAAAHAVVTAGVDGLGAAAGAAAWLDDDDALRLLAARGDTAGLVGPRGPNGEVPLTAQRPLSGAARSGEPRWAEDEAFAAVPLLVGNETRGALGFGFHPPSRFAPEDRAFVVLLASQAALACDRARRREAEALARRQAAEALNARERFVSVSAHELNSPLTSLRGHLQLLLRSLDRGLPPPDELRETLQSIDAQAARLTYLVTQLVGFARLGGGAIEPAPRRTNVAALARRAVGRVTKSAVGAGHRFVIRAPRALYANVDPEIVRQCADILLDNAIKYCPHAPPIDVEVRRLSVAPPVIQLAVRDCGPGIPWADRTSIFEPFYRGAAHASATEGLGLGLFICRRLAELHRGRLFAEYPPDGGTRLVLRLPG